MADRMRMAGLIVSTVVGATMIADGLAGLLWPEMFTAEMAADGWPAATLLPVSLFALAGGVLYAIPRTAMLGAIVITGFVGGAIATHLRVTQSLVAPEIVNVAIAVAAWGGLWLRDARVRALLP